MFHSIFILHFPTRLKKFATLPLSMCIEEISIRLWFLLEKSYRREAYEMFLFEYEILSSFIQQLQRHNHMQGFAGKSEEICKIIVG